MTIYKKDCIQVVEEINNLNGIIYKGLMDCFNILEENTSMDTDNIESITDFKQFKHIVLTWLSNSVDFFDGPEFRRGCISCKAERILGLLKYRICTKLLSDEDLVGIFKTSIVDYSIETKYTNDFHDSMQKIKTQILKYITSQKLRKRFHLNNFCMQLLKKEEKLLKEQFISDSQVVAPVWLDSMTDEELVSFAQQVVELINANEFDAFADFTKDK